MNGDIFNNNSSQTETDQIEKQVQFEEEILQFECQNFSDIVMPINIGLFARILAELGFQKEKLQTLVSGFTSGFNLGFSRNLNKRHFSSNLPFRIGTPADLWNKIMKEVSLNRYARPFTKEQIPYTVFMQSLIR